MTKSVAEHVADMLADIQRERPDPLDDTGNGRTPASPEPVAEATANEAEDTEPIHVFFVKDSALQAALLDAQSVEANAATPTTPQPATSPNTVTRKNTVISVGMFTICVLTSILLLLLFIVPQFVTPVATVTIIPVERTITATAAVQVHGRLLPALTLSQSQTAPATGKRHQDATQAHGTITFYNGLLTSQTIAAGTILTGADGVQVITDQPAVIPAASPPIEGQVTVPAHAVSVGAQGNIPILDINQACRVTSVLAKNTTAFTGGGAARDYSVVTREDIHNAVTTLLLTLSQSAHAALQAQLHIGEALLPTSCTPHGATDHTAGEEAREVRVTASITCTGIAYHAHDVYASATQMIHDVAMKRFGTGYQPLGDVTYHLLHVTIVHDMRGIAAIAIQANAAYVYQISSGEKQQLIRLIAGKPKQQALATLLQFPGIAGAQISVKGGNQTLPQEPENITIVIAERL